MPTKERMRKKSRRMVLEKVESNDELLMEILVRLPPKATFKCRCVSKRWSNMLIDPYFHKRYNVRISDEKLRGNGVGRLLAFVQDRRRTFSTGPRYLFSVLHIAQPNQQRIKEMPFTYTSLKHCTDGLVLFQDSGSIYFVVNPLNKTWVKLPPTNFDVLIKPGLVCEENKVKLVPSFKVVGIGSYYDRFDPNTFFIGTYSSETGNWKTYKFVCTEKLYFDTYRSHPFVCNGVFHWYIKPEGIPRLMVYNPVEENVVQFINLPMGCNAHFALTRTQRDDVLWVGTSDSEMIKFWMLSKDENGSYKSITTNAANAWILMHTVNNESLSSEMMLLLESEKRKKSVHVQTIANSQNYLKLVALIPWSPLVAVLTMKQKVFFHNLETKSTELVKYRGRPLSEQVTSAWYPFMESLYLSTYAPFERAYE